MELWIFASFFFALVILLVFGNAIPVYKNHCQATGDVINYDASMRKFVYSINLSYQQIIDLLNTKNNLDELSCTFDFDNSVIRFKEYGSHVDYYFQIQDCDGFSVLRLEQVALISMKSSVPYKLNPFIVNKLQAQVIPFSQYGF